MKRFITAAFLFLFASIVQAQTISYSVNGKKYTVEGISSNNFITAEWRAGEYILMNSKAVCLDHPTKYDRCGIQIEGREVGTYKVGCCDSKNYDEPYRSSIEATWYDAGGKENSKSTGYGWAQSSSGYIKITKMENAKISGTFYCNAAGTTIEGTFEDVFVRNWGN